MRRVLVECRNIERDAPSDRRSDAVHDLRVALRRCRSIAKAVKEIDPDPRWRNMRRMGRRLAQRFGEVRDAEVMRGWLERLGSPDDPVRRAMLATLGDRDAKLRRAGRRAIDRFDRRRWARLRHALAARLRELALDDLVSEHLALERYEDARALHEQAIRNRSGIAYHRLRIGLKRFRYLVESFLPERHAAWGGDLKRLQDGLGEAHDLDMLRTALARHRPTFDAGARARWRKRIEAERRARLDAYRRLALGGRSVWVRWRAGLPSGERLERAALATLAAWASCRDPRFRRTERVVARALAVFDALAAAKPAGPLSSPEARRILHAAAIVHRVGRMLGRRGHHKASCRMIRERRLLQGWSRDDMELVALVARYHRGAPPKSTHRAFGALGIREQSLVFHLAGILRLATQRPEEARFQEPQELPARGRFVPNVDERGASLSEREPFVRRAAEQTRQHGR